MIPYFITETKRHSGIATLPLHYGSAPRWLFNRMAKLARQIVIAIVEEFGTTEFIRRLSDPYWFQALGCILGFDWHSSGLTTTTCGALKEGLKGLENELGLFIAGGKGGASRKTPLEIERYAEDFGLDIDIDDLIYSSRMSAKVDNCALQDGYQLYHHNFVFNKEGLWAVIQQGMNTSSGWARRYHWISTKIDNFVTEPHKAICCNHRNRVLNLVAKKSKDTQLTVSLLARQQPLKVIREIRHIKYLRLPKEHTVFFNHLNPENLKSVLISTYEKQPKDFEALLGIKGVGPKTLRALSLLSELVYNTTIDRNDPAKYSFAHGGKDGHPYHIDKKEYDKSIYILETALQQSRIGHTEKKEAFRRLKRYFL